MYLNKTGVNPDSLSEEKQKHLKDSINNSIKIKKQYRTFNK